MSNSETTQMARFGITVERKNIYTYKGHKYERFNDVLKYATLDADRKAERPVSTGWLKRLSLLRLPRAGGK